RATARICTLPQTHPLHSIARRAASKCVKSHRSPLHYLFHLTGLRPDFTETITPIRRSRNCIVPHNTHIEGSKEDALRVAQQVNGTAPVRVYVDGSGCKGGIGASAVRYEGTSVIAVCRYYLGSSKRYTVHNGEAVGIIMGMHLLLNFTRQLTGPTIIGCDNQAVIRGLNNQQSHSGHHLLDHIHKLEEQLHAKQDRKQEDGSEIKDLHRWHPNIHLKMRWIPGHFDNRGNKAVDEEAKQAEKGETSQDKGLPARFRSRRVLPTSKSSTKQAFYAKLKVRSQQSFEKSPRYAKMSKIDKTMPSDKYRKLIKTLPRKHASILTQLRAAQGTRTAQAAPTPDQMCGLTHTSQLRDGARNDRALTGHAPLKQHLHRIKCADSPICPSCEMEPETTAHFLIWPPGRCCVPCNHQAPSARKEAPILG
ncbi:hypothetical protein FIBSPDRAFT_732299, partial [Athelia psychrophila]